MATSSIHEQLRRTKHLIEACNTFSLDILTTQMRPFTPQYIRQINSTFSPNVRAQLSRVATRTMASSSDHGELKIENTNIKTAPGVDLSDQQKTFVGCVLDLFAGRPSLAKLDLWKDDAVFRDPIATAQGRKEFAPQWYDSPPVLHPSLRSRKQLTCHGYHQVRPPNRFLGNRAPLA